MTITESSSVGTTSGRRADYDVVIIGAGIAGIYQLYQLKDCGLSVRVLEAGTGVGGTWYWNRYPLARFDSESYSYGYFFSKELLQEWEWSSTSPGSPRPSGTSTSWSTVRSPPLLPVRHPGDVGRLRRGGRPVDAAHQ